MEAMTDALRASAIEKGQKLIGLYRRGVGGERANAGRLLHAHLRAHDLTLFDLDGSLPVTQDVAALEGWRESAALLASVLGGALPQDAQDEALTRLVDADDLTDAEVARLLPLVDLETLIDVRADGWAYAAGSADGEAEQADSYRQAGRRGQPADILAYPGSLAERLREATLRAHFVQTHPERLIRAAPGVPQRFLLGVLASVTGRPAVPDPEGARAHLDAGQLARVRALLANHAAQAEAIALDAAEAFGRTLR